MIPGDRNPTAVERGIDFVALWRVVWGYRYLILGTSALAGIVAVILALTSAPIYRAELTVTEAQDGGMSGMAALTSQFGGLASLAGINLPSGGTVNREGQAILKSRRLVEQFIKSQNLLDELFPNSKKQPTLWFAVKKFQESVLSIREDARSGMTTISIDWGDGATAARLANQFVALANELIRTRAMDGAKRNIKYLNEQLELTSVVELRRVIYNLIEAETKTLMLANAKSEYAFTIVDPAVPPEVRISPRRALMVVFGVIIGFLIGIVAGFIHNLLRHQKSAIAQPRP